MRPPLEIAIGVGMILAGLWAIAAGSRKVGLF